MLSAAYTPAHDRRPADKIRSEKAIIPQARVQMCDSERVGLRGRRPIAQPPLLVGCGARSAAASPALVAYQRRAHRRIPLAGKTRAVKANAVAANNRIIKETVLLQRDDARASAEHAVEEPPANEGVAQAYDAVALNTYGVRWTNHADDVGP